MVEVNDEDRIKAEIYFNEQQQLLNQPQIYYNGMVQTAPQLVSTANNGPMQLDHQLYAIAQSPRLKPITIVDKQLISNAQNVNNTNNPKFRNNTNNKNGLDKMNKEINSRYRNQF